MIAMLLTISYFLITMMLIYGAAKVELVNLINICVYIISCIFIREDSLSLIYHFITCQFNSTDYLSRKILNWLFNSWKVIEVVLLNFAFTESYLRLGRTHVPRWYHLFVFCINCRVELVISCRSSACKCLISA